MTLQPDTRIQDERWKYISEYESFYCQIVYNLHSVFDQVLGQDTLDKIPPLGRHGGHAGGAGGDGQGRTGGRKLHGTVLRLLTLSELVQAVRLEILDSVHLVSGLAAVDCIPEHK